MEFIGRIARVLPKQSGTSKAGNPWESQPFVFEYFERPDDRYPDRVVLETMDTKIMPYLKEGLEVRIGFGHNVSEYEGRTYNRLRMYKIESIKKEQQAAQASTTPQPQVQAPFPPMQPPQENDDLPF